MYDMEEIDLPGRACCGTWVSRRGLSPQQAGHNAACLACRGRYWHVTLLRGSEAAGACTVT